MEYEFRYDLFNRPEASCEIQPFGRWLGEELGDNRAQIEEILARCEQLLSNRRGHCEWHGHEMSLELDPESARVWLQDTSSEELEQGFGLNDEAGEAGLEDFFDLLNAWYAYLYPAP